MGMCFGKEAWTVIPALLLFWSPVKISKTPFPRTGPQGFILMTNEADTSGPRSYLRNILQFPLLSTPPIVKQHQGISHRLFSPPPWYEYLASLSSSGPPGPPHPELVGPPWPWRWVHRGVLPWPHPVSPRMPASIPGGGRGVTWMLLICNEYSVTLCQAQ